jgi:hypothetical protein
MTCAPKATRTRDLPLRRSFHVPGSTAAFLVRGGLLVVWLPLDACGFRLVRAREGHGAGGARRLGLSGVIEYLTVRSDLREE